LSSKRVSAHMPITLQALKAAINPLRTALILGAGASVPSGAPTGSQLAAGLWKSLANSDPKSNDLLETASFLTRTYGRAPVVNEIRRVLSGLKPTGGLAGLPVFQWRQIFTTNFDELIEKAYQQRGLPISVIRSNYDFTNTETSEGTKIFKIHGCITQDVSLGHKASMLLTETDYERFETYRQASFASLQSALMIGDILIIGQSLRDPHLFELIKRTLTAKREGAPGNVYALTYDQDDVRAPLLEDRGARMAFGGIDEFVHTMSADFRSPEPHRPSSVTNLPVNLVSTVIEVVEAAKLPPNVRRMFNGGAATYADIRAGATFKRSGLTEVIEQLKEGKALVATITGAAGVGKTTLARQLMLEILDSGVSAWEHRSDFYFDHQAWLKFEAELRTLEQTGVLFVDECTSSLRAVNELVNKLAAITAPAIRLVLTANSSQWAPRVKSPKIFSKGRVIELSKLVEVELNALINLVQHNNEIANLVSSSFKRLPRSTQIATLRQKCSADMFVCLNNIFANQSLDVILLQEFEALADHLQEYYRYVAALEAVGTRVHRQLLLRMLKSPAQQISAALAGLTGIVDEYDIDERLGIYGWSTRHLVIARIISDYKFSSLEELQSLFVAIIENINPTVAIELQSLRAICDSDYGIGRLGDSKTRKNLYRRLIEVAPGERIPWHRLIRELLNEGDLDEAEFTIRAAEEAVRIDAPLSRYKVRLLVMRAQKTKGISNSDRLALLRKAYELARRNIDHFHWDKFSYRELCNVAIRLAERGESAYILDEAISMMRAAAEEILDPTMTKEVREFEQARARLR
jgi:SIR2-like domain